MRKFNIDFNKAFKFVIIAYAIIFIAGTVASLFGINLDINFSGGAKVAYSYTGDISVEKIEKVAKKAIDAKFTVSKSTALAGDTETFEIALSGKNALPADKQEALTAALEKEFKDNKINLYNSNSVSPTIAGTFFAKSIVAVVSSKLRNVIHSDVITHLAS